MNWLTSQIDEMPPFASLSSQGAVGLQRVDVSRLTLARGRFSYEADISPFEQELLREGFALVESEAAANNRLDVAEYGDDLPDSFSLAINDGSGAVLYLPETSNDDKQSLQLFISEGGQVGRLRAEGDFTRPRPHIERVTTVPPDGICADGPCGDWGSDCGSGCVCRKFEIPPKSRLARGRGRRYALRCR